MAMNQMSAFGIISTQNCFSVVVCRRSWIEASIFEFLNPDESSTKSSVRVQSNSINMDMPLVTRTISDDLLTRMRHYATLNYAREGRKMRKWMEFQILIHVNNSLTIIREALTAMNSKMMKEMEKIEKKRNKRSTNNACDLNVKNVSKWKVLYKTEFNGHPKQKIKNRRSILCTWKKKICDKCTWLEIWCAFVICPRTCGCKSDSFYSLQCTIYRFIIR